MVFKDANPSADTGDLEGEIDRRVHELYGLTDLEVAAVEGGRTADSVYPA